VGNTGRQGARELRILNAIAEALNSAADVQQALERTLALVADLLGLRTGWVWLVDPQSGRFYSAAAQNLPPYLQEPVRMTGSSCYCIDAFRGGSLTPKNIHLIGCSRLGPALAARDVEGTRGLCCHASIPLCFGERPLGIMNITAPEWRELTADELRLLSTIAYQVGIAIDRARLAEATAQAARAEERARIAREIHDTLAQGLTAIGLHLESALTHLETRPDLARARVERALAASRENLEEARRSVLDLRAAPGEGRGLEESLRALARGFTAETGVRVRTRIALGPSLRLPERVESELHRIAGEALANVGRHARATAVTLSLEPAPGGIRLIVRDNGAGFDPRAPRSGHGILGMRERARLLGGTLRISSRPGRGTAVAARVPLEGKESP
jgi:two-component system NarL family sensor kinase